MNGPRRSGAVFQLYQAHRGMPVYWRLLSGNNREAGRGVAGHPDGESCRISVKELQRDADLLEPRIRRAEGHGWTWSLLLDDVPVAHAGRAFDRAIRCRQAVELVVALVPDALVANGVLVSADRRSGRSA